MKIFNCYYLLLMLTVFGLSSCSGSSQSDDPKVKTMDSISTELEKTNKELDDQTAKLEASIEKIEELESKK